MLGQGRAQDLRQQLRRLLRLHHGRFAARRDAKKRDGCEFWVPPRSPRTALSLGRGSYPGDAYKDAPTPGSHDILLSYAERMIAEMDKMQRGRRVLLGRCATVEGLSNAEASQRTGLRTGTQVSRDAGADGVGPGLPQLPVRLGRVGETPRRARPGRRGNFENERVKNKKFKPTFKNEHFSPTILQPKWRNVKNPTFQNEHFSEKRQVIHHEQGEGFVNTIGAFSRAALFPKKKKNQKKSDTSKKGTGARKKRRKTAKKNKPKQTGAMNGFRVPAHMKGPLDTFWKIR